MTTVTPDKLLADTSDTVAEKKQQSAAIMDTIFCHNTERHAKHVLTHNM